VIAAVKGAQISAYSPENGAGESNLNGNFDSDSWRWVLDTAWVVYPANPNDSNQMAVYREQRLKYCDADYVENGTEQPLLAPPPPSKSLACKENPARIRLMDTKPVADDAQAAPYRVVGTPGNPPFHYTYYHLDHLGSPRILTNNNGARVQGQHFLPFGQEMPIEAGLNSRKFTGHERDPETGLDYMLARYYQANLGRFLSVDPSTKSSDIRDPQSWNRFVYVRNNPMLNVDPDGQDLTDFISGAANAFSSDMLAGTGRVEGVGGDYARGQTAGDIGAAIAGVVETVLGAGGEVGGLALDATGVGAVVGVPAGVVSTGAMAQGVAAVGVATTHLMSDAAGGGTSGGPKAKDAPGVTAGGQATDKYGNKLGPSGEKQINKTTSTTREGARNKALNEGAGAVEHRNPKEGKRHFQATDNKGNKKPSSTHHEY
jgi:RHS repeat-associated protein